MHEAKTTSEYQWYSGTRAVEMQIQLSRQLYQLCIHGPGNSVSPAFSLPICEGEAVPHQVVVRMS